MAIFSEIEKQFFIRKTGSKKPLNEMKSNYFRSQGAVGFSVEELERCWLRIAIAAAGGTPSGTQTAGLWKQLVSALGYGGTNFINENKLRYYLNN